jgi:alpha-L-rhamnosidase
VSVIPKLRVEHRRDTLGIGTAVPRLSWHVDPLIPNWEQASFEIEQSLGDGCVQTERAETADSVLVDWPFAPLRSRQRVSVRIRLMGVDGHQTAWTDPVAIEAGLLDPSDWLAVPIAAPSVDDLDPSRPIRFRRGFVAPADVVCARLYVSALGVHVTELNGDTVGDSVLAPGWTSYANRLHYETFDVTAQLRAGPNALGITVAEGWFRGRLGFEGGRRAVYGDRIGPIAQLELHRADGTIVTVATDRSWRAAHGPHCAASLYDGETYDARLAEPRWSHADFDDSGWATVEELATVAERLVAPSGPPVRRLEELAPVSITSSPSGRTIVDFGQNISGWLRITVRGTAGEQVTLRHAEVLEDGELGVRPLRLADATDRYVLNGSGVETWEPAFTIHGFRYAELESWPGEPSADDLRAVVCHSDMDRTGHFECSDAGLQQLHDNVVWSMRGNFVHVPTDCPQRDERLGWTGDLQVFSPTASFLYDCVGLLDSWLEDLAAEQQQFGTVPVYVPWMKLNLPAIPTAAWGDAAVVVPWVLYERFGDAELLKRQYPSMRAWVDQVTQLAGVDHLWNAGFQYGDWLDPATPPDEPAAARTDPGIVATAYHAYTARILASAAQVIGESADAERYFALAKQVVAAFNAEYVTPSGRLASDAPTAYALALRFDLLRTGGQRRRAAERLVELLEIDEFRIGTGFVGTPIICDALADSGHVDEAYHLLLQDRCPSWLYPVTMGATTVWERWDSMLPDGSINPGEMTSFNHYAFGAVADFLHRVVAGIAPAAPGYRRLLVRPRPGGGLTSAGASLSTVYGEASVRWVRSGSQLDVDLIVPPGTTATVDLPGSAPIEVRAGRHRLGATVRPAADDPPRPPRRSPEGEFACRPTDSEERS